jgi:hypothetical protein
MGISTFPNVASPIKSIQRGVAVSAGNITITAVNAAKTQVNSFSTGAAGTVAATGDISATYGTTSGMNFAAPSGYVSFANSIAYAYQQSAPYTAYNTVSYVGGRYGTTTLYTFQYFVSTSVAQALSMNPISTNGMNMSTNATAISGGSTNLTSAQYGAYLSNSTTLVVTGPCRYEVVEHY